MENCFAVADLVVAVESKDKDSFLVTVVTITAQKGFFETML
jgi:hypothetical protein